MSSRLEPKILVALEEQAYAHAKLRFAEDWERLASFREAVERLERNISILASAAAIAASNPGPNEQVIQTDDGGQWIKSVELLENIHLCLRRCESGHEFAAVEHFPAHNAYEIWNRGNVDAVEVVRTFAREQRHALRIWMEDTAGEVRAFLTETYPGLETASAACNFMQRAGYADSQNDPEPSG